MKYFELNSINSKKNNGYYEAGPCYFVSSPRTSVNGKKHAFIKSCGNVFY